MAEAKPNEKKAPKLESEISTRPPSLPSKSGTSGKKVTLRANYFKLTSQTDWCLYQYRVDIEPDEENTYIRKALLRQHNKALGFYLCDGTTLFTSNRYKEPLELKSIDEKTKQPRVIKLRFASDLMRGDYQYLQLFNLIVRKCLENLDFKLVGRNYYDPKAKLEVPDYKLEIWPGFITSIRQHERDIMMCSEISHKIMRNEKVLDILLNCLRKDRKEYQTLFQNTVINLVVLTDYNNRTYRIDDVDFTKNPSHTFELKSKEKISFAQYYKNKYNIILKDMKQPLLVSLSKAKERRGGAPEMIYLIPELCRTTGITDDMRANFALMKKLSEKTRVAPKLRIEKLLQFNVKLATHKKVVEDLQQWNFKLDKNLVDVPGRVLPAEKIKFGNKILVTPKNADWNFDMQEKPAFHVHHELKDWTVLVPSSVKQQALNFLKLMVANSALMGFTMRVPRIIEIVNDNAEIFKDSIEKVMSGSNPQLVVCIVTSNQLVRYAAIKTKLCIDRPVPSQVILSRTLVQKTPSRYKAVGSKIAAQINCKLGGIPWTVDIRANWLGLMVVGFDVCHIKGGKDYGAMVASLDQDFGRYYSAVSHHDSGTELSNDLSNNLKQAVRVFQLRNQNRKPSRIVIYRDGVGEGQVNFVYNYEVDQVKKALAEIYEGNNYRLGFIIVTKRLNTRIFDGEKNPSPGTVVDDVITDPLKYDFFIVSQSVHEGTVAPTAYNVIEDNLGVTPDAIQQLTYKLCHMYFNFSGTVRVPAPCQYAHKLAFFASTALQQSAHASLRELLYFL